METQASTQKPATIRELAAVFDKEDFPIWDRESLNDIPSNEKWAELANPYLVTLRVAAIVMTKQKDELVEMIENLEADAGSGKSLLEDLVPRFQETEEFFNAMLKTVEGAETRLLTAACKRAVMANMEGLDDA